MQTTYSLPISKQESILQNSIRDGVKLSDVLETFSLSYDDLRYRHNQSIPRTLTTYQKINNTETKQNGIPTVSFFSGAGGLDLGFESAGFQHLASFEINELFCKTLKYNRPDWNIFGPPNSSGDLRNREEVADILRNQLGLKPPFNGVFHGGPPCQPFSIAANQRFSKSGDNFKRVGYAHEETGNLLFDYIWQIQMFKPAIFLIENVPGLKTLDNGEQLTKAITALQKYGYTVAKPTFLNARNFGVPQSRLRIFIVGWRNQKRHFCYPSEDLLEVPSYSALLDVDSLPNHITRKHKAKSILRYMELEYGQRDKRGRVDRLDPSLPSKTVIAGGNGGGGRSHLHPYIPRTLSPRESARLQTFPDDYIFCGSPARQLTQVGNAVPPLLGKKIADAIYEYLFA
ncbi:DNA-cytosine methyltransferase [hydrothermal vent metagenome]|uniref:DNA (cytosine-5-)-methyltransferase n=1 Tax=hydrothermal vent metagenome TaxID=652676 RepID=A0A3B0VIR8_9ZZZZ